MLDFRNAFFKAMSVNNKVNYYTEYNDVIVFGEHKDDANAFAVLKESEHVVRASDLIGMTGYNGDLVFSEANYISEGDATQRVHAEQFPTHGARYILEHRMLPDLLYEYGVQFMALLVDKETFVFDTLSNMLEQEHVDNPYSLEQFVVEPFRVEDTMVARLIFPEPEDSPLCYETYALFNPRTNEANYFALEKGEKENEYFLCGWNQKGAHINYGKTEYDFDSVMEMIIGIIEGQDNSRKPEASFDPESKSVTAYVNDDGELLQ